MLVKAVPGRRVRDPMTRAVVGDAPHRVGDTDKFWLRRLRDGDVVRADTAQPESPPAAPAAPTAPR